MGQAAKIIHGIAHTTFKCKAPLGYRTILKTRILDGDGNIIKELSEEMPTEIQNFNATVSFGNIGGSTIKYRNGGKQIYEHVIGADGSSADFRCLDGKMEVNIPGTGMGWMTYGGSCTPIGEAMMLYLPQVLQTYDYCLWMKEVLNHPTPGMMFGEAYHLGYKCKTVSISDGTIIYWQNLIMEILGDEPFRVTSLEILDNPLE